MYRFLLIVCISLLSSTAQAKLFYWQQILGGNVLDHRWLRVITDKKTCPKVKLNDIEHEMSLYTRPTSDYPVTTCRIKITNDVRTISLNDEAIYNDIKEVKRILVLGDTGCRDRVTDCTSEWVFPHLVEVMQKYKPDLVIHVGDYVYRNKYAVKNKWQVWKDDFFTPASPLLTSALWVIVRGNHESCSRQGSAWARFFGDKVFPICNADIPPYAIDIDKNLRLIVMDSSNIRQLNMLTQYVKDFKAVNSLAKSKSNWLLTHVPIFYFGTHNTDVMFNAFKQVNLTNITNILAGHSHVFAYLSTNARFPKQIISGNGGAELHKNKISAREIKDLVEFSLHSRYGFLILEKELNHHNTMNTIGEFWKASAIDKNNKVMAVFYLKPSPYLNSVITTQATPLS